MPIYRIADLNIDIQNKYPHLEQQCAGYAAPADAVPDLTVSVSEEEIDAALALQPQFSRGYHESICMYRRLCTALLHHDRFLVHAAVIKYGGQAYAFSAKSGTGKSTHISLWRKYFGEDVTIINGDKPILRRADDHFVAYGTPWCGKEGWNRNDRAPLKAICFIERSTENYIRPLDAREAVERIFHQMLRPKTVSEMDLTISLTDALLRTVPIYVLGCDISREAAELSFRTLTAAKKEE
ncbi:MAG: hypothetical protein IJY20_01635 [Clostridia bacterium]|nr:hypothetical protein [Clostridia bacterium]